MARVVERERETRRMKAAAAYEIPPGKLRSAAAAAAAFAASYSLYMGLCFQVEQEVELRI